VSTTAERPSSKRAAASVVVQHASRVLLADQDPQGCWLVRAGYDITLAAEIVLAREFLGIAGPEATSSAARQIRAAQQEDGGWDGGEPGPAPDPSASVLAYLALRVAGDPADAYHMAAAAGWIRDAGGLDSAGVSAQIWLAMFGLTEWAEVPVPSPEAVCLPARAMLAVPGLGAWTGWSRVAAVTAAIIGALRPVRSLPLELSELRASRGRPFAQRGRGPLLAAPPVRAAQRAMQPVAVRQSGQWLAGWQERLGQPDGPRLVWPCSLIALDALGYPRSHPAQVAGLAWLDSAGVGARPAAACLPPVRQSAFAVDALRVAGLAADNPAVVAAGRWLVGQRIQGQAGGRGALAEPAACGWSFGPDGYPRPADTALVLLALSRVDPSALTGGRVLGNAARWLAGMQGRDGSWAGCAVLTGYGVRALASQPSCGDAEARAVRRGTVWLLRAQAPDGSWPGQRAGSDLLATSVALTALRAAGVHPTKPAVRTAAGWLLGRQNPDGGWRLGNAAGGQRPGGSDRAGTARAMVALLAAGGQQTSDAVDAAAGWLTRALLTDSGSPELLAALGSYLAAEEPCASR